VGQAARLLHSSTQHKRHAAKGSYSSVRTTGARVRVSARDGPLYLSWTCGCLGYGSLPRFHGPRKVLLAVRLLFGF
jgi:hypothetical protein